MTTMMSIGIALDGPPEPSAIRTANAPLTIAPKNGM